MQISAPGISERGFTLIEMLVVVMIIAIAASMVGLSVASSSDRALHTDALRLVDAFAVAQSEARSDGRVIRWSANAHGWWFERPGRSPRLSAEDEGPLRPDRFDQDSSLKPQSWSVHDVIVLRSPDRPVIFGTEWIADPLVLEISTQDDSVRITRNATGDYAIE